MASKKETPANSTANTEEKYSSLELIEASENVFNIPKECAVAALRYLKPDHMLTVAEANKIVDDFMKKEVK